MLEIKHYSNENYLLVTKTGVVSLEAAVDMIKKVKEDPSFCSDANRLYDFSDAILNWGVKDINRLIEYIKGKFGKTKSTLKIAIVNSDSTEQSLSDLFICLAEHELDRNFQLFTSVDSAQEWMTEP